MFIPFPDESDFHAMATTDSASGAAMPRSTVNARRFRRERMWCCVGSGNYIFIWLQRQPSARNVIAVFRGPDVTAQSVAPRVRW